MIITVNHTPIVVKNNEISPVDRAIEYYVLRKYPGCERRKMSVISTESSHSRDGKSAVYHVDVLAPLTKSTRQFVSREVVVVEYA